jgi:hypothetical protein
VWASGLACMFECVCGRVCACVHVGNAGIVFIPSMRDKKHALLCQIRAVPLDTKFRAHSVNMCVFACACLGDCSVVSN